MGAFICILVVVVVGIVLLVGTITCCPSAVSGYHHVFVLVLLVGTITSCPSAVSGYHHLLSYLHVSSCY